MTRCWDVQGEGFSTVWGATTATLDLAGPTPGLRLGGPGGGRVLGLAGAADVGRFDPDAFGRATLASVERHFNAVRATYRPPHWGGMKVAATWSLVGDSTVDLMIHLQADSVDELRSVEILLISSPSGTIPSAWPRVEAKDAEKAALSADGRESGEIGIAAINPRGVVSPFVNRLGETAYVEFVQPADYARRLYGAESVRTTLFGHALEKGVAIRGRLRAWRPEGTIDPLLIERERDRFQAEPPPLGP